MATIQKRDRKDGPVYRAMVRIKGFPDQHRTFRRLSDAKTWTQKTEIAIRDGEFKNVVKTASSKTLKNVIERYRMEVLAHKASSTQRAEASYLAYWERALGDHALAYINADLVTGKLNQLSKAGDARRKPKDNPASETAATPKSRKTLKHYRDTLELLFKHARRWSWTGSNPLDGVAKITKIRNERTRYLRDDERDALLKACKDSSNTALYTIVLLALSTGARRGEILNLTLDDVDTDRSVAVLRNTKNGDTRTIPIISSIRTLVRAQIKTAKKQYQTQELKPTTRWLFPRRDGAEPVDIRSAWEAAVTKARLHDFRFHDLRHSTASYLAMNGASQLEIAEVLGHRTLQMVKRYAHLSEGHTHGLVEAMSKKIFNFAK